MKFRFGYGKIYYLCRNQNNIKSKCKSQKRQVYGTKCNDANNDNVSIDDDDYIYLNAVHNKQSDTLTALLEVNERKVIFQIDTDAQANTVCQRYVRREQVHPTTKNLIIWKDLIIKVT